MQWPGCVGLNPVGKASSHQMSSNQREEESKKIPVVQTSPQLKEGLGCSRSTEHRNTGLTLPAGTLLYLKIWQVKSWVRRA